MYMAEVNKHRHLVSRRFFIDRAAHSKNNLKLFKRWYYLTRGAGRSLDPVTWHARYAAYSKAKTFHLLAPLAGGFDPYFDPLWRQKEDAKAASKKAARQEKAGRKKE